MNTYVDKDYLIAKDTIVTYTGTSNNIDVPGNFDKIHLLRIGNSAFAELNRVEQLKLPYGVERIEDMAFQGNSNMRCIKIPGTVQHFGTGVFFGCHQLNDIIIYDIQIDKNTYQKLKGDSIRTVDDVYVSEHIPRFISDTGFRGIDNTPAAVVPKNIPVLFRFDKESCGRNSNELFRDIDNFRFSKSENLTNENSAFIYQMKTDRFGSVSYVAEMMNDFAVKSEKPLPKEKTYVFTFDDTQTKEKNGNVYITATIKFGFFFWQSGQKVICNKTDYYVYRRLYLSSKEEIEFVKEDVAIYKDTELVLNRKEAQQVYGKYKLLSIL